MTELTSDQLVEFASLLVTLVIFFGIDAKFRSRRGRSPRSEVSHVPVDPLLRRCDSQSGAAPSFV